MAQEGQIYISYSRTDEHLVKPLFELLRLDGRRVFLDTDSIIPGSKWAEEIKSALIESEVLVLFWCCHSAKSDYVEKEIAEILKNDKKRVIPCLFCSTPVPNSISQFQWVDFRKVVVHSCPCQPINFKDAVLPATLAGGVGTVAGSVLGAGLFGPIGLFARILGFALGSSIGNSQYHDHNGTSASAKAVAEATIQACVEAGSQDITNLEPRIVALALKGLINHPTYGTTGKSSAKPDSA